jgi:hypothetical protein
MVITKNFEANYNFSTVVAVKATLPFLYPAPVKKQLKSIIVLLLSKDLKIILL